MVRVSDHDHWNYSYTGPKKPTRQCQLTKRQPACDHFGYYYCLFGALDLLDWYPIISTTNDQQSLAVITLSLRLWVRIKDRLWGWDDLFVVLAGIASFVGDIMVCMSMCLLIRL